MDQSLGAKMFHLVLLRDNPVEESPPGLCATICGEEGTNADISRGNCSEQSFHLLARVVHSKLCPEGMMGSDDVLRAEC